LARKISAPAWQQRAAQVPASGAKPNQRVHPRPLEEGWGAYDSWDQLSVGQRGREIGSGSDHRAKGGYTDVLALLVSIPGLGAKSIKTPVSNQQVPATIAKALGIDPNEIDAVRKERVKVLPFLFSDNK
jgi:hypothetical protein